MKSSLETRLEALESVVAAADSPPRVRIRFYTPGELSSDPVSSVGDILGTDLLITVWIPYKNGEEPG